MAEFKHKAEFEKVTALAETTAAVLCEMGDGQQVWFPKTQIDDDSEVFEKGHDGKLVVSQWIAEQKNLV